jgi:outer membrane protein OmpA-like peptidoglycan-associated protein
MHSPIEQRFLCTGTVIDDESGTPMVEVDVTLIDAETGSVVEVRQSDVNGKYSFAVQKDKAYKLKARAKGRYDGESRLSTENIEQQQIVARDIHMVPEAGIYLRGAVHLADRLGYVEGAMVTLVNTQSFYQEQKTTGADGGFSFRLSPNEEFEVLVEKPGYYSISVPVTTVGVKQGVIDLNLAKDLAFERIELDKPAELKYVKWSGTSTTLEPIARTELDGLADRLQVNPSITIEIGVHSDARGDLANELKLSQKRAEAVQAYLKSKGVAPGRVTAKGYGATRLLNHCAPGVTCTEAEHAANRRTVYTVTSTGQ